MLLFFVSAQDFRV